MTLGDCETTGDAVSTLQRMRSYMPYRLGGTWFVSAWNGEGRAYRRQSDLVNAAARDGLAELSVVRIGKLRQKRTWDN